MGEADLLKSIVMAALCSAAASACLAKDASYIGQVEIIRSAGDGRTSATGTVFIDANRNAKFDVGEVGLVDVQVSNGREVVLTDADGRYELPAYDDMDLFVTKPAGYAPPVNAQMIPQFSYAHKTNGSPELQNGGIPATGPYPKAVNFPFIVNFCFKVTVDIRGDIDARGDIYARGDIDARA